MTYKTAWPSGDLQPPRHGEIDSCPSCRECNGTYDRSPRLRSHLLHRGDMDARAGSGGSIMGGTLWMIGLSILFFWLPVIGPLIAGFVGGRKAGGVGPAIIAAILPAVLAAVLLFLLGTAVALPIIGAFAAAGLFAVIVSESVPLILAAAIGGATT